VTTLFSLNFRRQAYLAEVARARRRVFALAVWVAYFGVFAVLLGLYGLNCVALNQRLHQVERQTTRLKQSGGAGAQWTVSQTELDQVEQYVLGPRRWRDRLIRLATVLPNNARITSLVVNPQNLNNPLDQNKLVITGLLRATAERSEMEGVMGVVSLLRADSVFAADYRNIKLASTRAFEGAGDVAQFVIECR
jgi:Tfp pilus assembly protein PilN